MTAGLKHLRDEAAAEDPAQEVLLVTIERLRAGEVRNPDEIGSFILGTARCRGLDGAEDATSREPDGAVPRAGTLRRASRRVWRHRAVERCLHLLAERDRGCSS